MSTTYTVDRAPLVDHRDLEAVTLSSSKGLSVVFVPGAGMVGMSMTLDGVELLGMREGLADYLESGKTFGIPLLAPWANRLEVATFDGAELVTDGTAGVHTDINGLPIHGLLAGCPDWEVVRCEAVDSGGEKGAWLIAELNFDSQRPEFPAFPFPHRLRVSVRVRGRKVMIATTVEATGDRDVPVAFGWHPYLCPPDSDRADWSLARPFVHHVLLDDRCVPTSEVEHGAVEIDTLGDPAADGRTYDDLYCDVGAGTTAWIEGGRHRISVTYDSGYPYAVLFAPADQRLVAIEPMTAPTDPLAGYFPIRRVNPGDSFTAQFTIAVKDSGAAT
ncbi:MAG: aldose 1-epimerase [Candidatus Nanopelagicales bacterium]